MFTGIQVVMPTIVIVTILIGALIYYINKWRKLTHRLHVKNAVCQMVIDVKCVQVYEETHCRERAIAILNKYKVKSLQELIDNMQELAALSLNVQATCMSCGKHLPNWTYPQAKRGIRCLECFHTEVGGD